MGHFYYMINRFGLVYRFLHVRTTKRSGTLMSSERQQPNLDNVFFFKERLLKYISKRMIKCGVVSDNKNLGVIRLQNCSLSNTRKKCGEEIPRQESYIRDIVQEIGYQPGKLIQAIFFKAIPKLINSVVITFGIEVVMNGLKL